MLKKKIVSKDIQIVSFDIFDTLVYRPFWNPTDLFFLLGQYVEKLIGSSDFLDFQTLRTEAEKKAREINKIHKPAREDITLDEIYSVLANELDATFEQVEKIKQKEIELEIQYCHPRTYAKELFDLAIATGKRVIITSDMYLPKDIVEKILANCGYTSYEFLFLSNEIGLTKATGRLFTYIAKKMHVTPKQILHIGDNQQSDVQMAKKMGLQAFHFPKAIDRFTNCIPMLYSGEIFSKIYQNPIALRDRNQFDRFFGWKTLLAVAANYIFDNPLIPFHPDTDFNADPRIVAILLWDSICLGYLPGLLMLLLKKTIKILTLWHEMAISPWNAIKYSIRYIRIMRNCIISI